MAGRKRTTRKKSAKEVPAVTLDDALAMLVQLDPENLDGFRQLAEMLRTVASGTSLNSDAAELVKAAAEQLDRFVSSENSDVEEVLVEASMLLEKASDSRDAGLKNLRAEEYPAVPPAPSEPAESPLPEPSDPEPEETAVEWLPSDADPGLLAEFVAESRELLEKSESALLALESNPEDDEAVNTVFRAFHTVKGTSGFLGLKMTSNWPTWQSRC